MDTSTYLKGEMQEMQNKTAKPMMWIGIVSIIMLFAGLTSAYIVRQAEGNWLQFDLPNQFYISTVCIVFSSITMRYALGAIKANNANGFKMGLLVTFILGLGFAFFQFSGWEALVEQGIYFTGARSNAAAAYLYVISGVHLAHMAGGIIALIFTLVKAYKNKYSRDNYLGIELVGIYWHFLDILWIYLLLFLLFIR